MQKFCLTILSFVVVLAMVGSANADRGRGSRGDGNDKGLECRARLSGDQEVPPVTTITTGRFRIEFNENETAAKFELRVNDGERVRQAHIHCAPAGVNGAIVAFLAGLHEGVWPDLDSLRRLPQDGQRLDPCLPEAERRRRLAAWRKAVQAVLAFYATR